jgi:hypothetical protein
VIVQENPDTIPGVSTATAQTKTPSYQQLASWQDAWHGSCSYDRRQGTPRGVHHQRYRRIQMAINFFPSRANMMQEIDRLVTLGNLDMLHSLCNCCLFRMFEPDHECQGCKIRVGIRLIGRDIKRDVAEEDALLGIC